ncbi:PH-interacting protein-like isoform X2 [Pomacea canaliculata]|uniref:PH-interacting protein-like isoform X2 n=1 Tax=Pomacea canaliculata TaxID=400727 RepID=UPI000D7339FF|nr:PH-interacting protein-like isoform X2 [Pomacea canaliculata]
MSEMSRHQSTGIPPSSVETELYFLIARFLSSGPCKQAAEVLLRELAEHEFLPKGVDWEGNPRTKTYEELVRQNHHIRADHLLQICQRVGPLLDQLVPTNIYGVRSLLGAGNLSLLRTLESIRHTKWPLANHIAVRHGACRVPPQNLLVPSFVQTLHARTASGVAGSLTVSLYSKLVMHDRKLGHLSAVYCVTYDRTGRYIFTGADDALVKIWNADSGRLLATLRGHSSEITDLAVNYENTLLASSSCDKMVRVWCLRTKAPLAVLQGHTGAINTLQFSPQCKGDNRILLSAGADGCVCFWMWNVVTNLFNPRPLKFVERSHAGAQMLCSSFSPGGSFLATGNSDHVIRVYLLNSAKPEKICELEAHSNKVDSMCYSNNSNRFVSGSEDGTARIWRYERQEWRAVVLDMATKLDSKGSEVVAMEASTAAAIAAGVDKLRVTMVSWNVDDSLVVTAVSDCSIKVWDSYTGKLMHILQAHQDEVFVLDAHPKDRRILVSAGHDGNIVVWDIVAGIKIKTFFNNIQGQGHGAVYDCKFTPDGQSFAATDSHGHLLFFGFGSNEKIKQVPQEVFFHTDYRPLIRDTNNFVLDEQTQQPPHLMPPPFLVNIDGNPYPPLLQRLVPGRENLKDEQLIPEIAINEAGDSEVIGDGDPNLVHGHQAEPNEAGNAPMQAVSGTHRDHSYHAEGRRQAMAGGHNDEEEDEHDDGNSMMVRDRADRPSIDDMIQRLQREQDQRILAEGGELPMASPPPVEHQQQQQLRPRQLQGRVGMRRSGEREGVRQSLNMSQRTSSSGAAAFSKRVIIKGINHGVLRKSEEKRQAFADEEIRKYIVEKKKKPSVPNTPSTLFGQVSKSKHQPSTKAGSSRQGPEHTARNRLTTRALYDTEEEEEEEENESDNVPSEQDSDTSEYSDWTMEGSSNLQPPKRRSQRKPKQKHISSSEDDAEDDNEEADDLDEDEEDDHENEALEAALKRSDQQAEAKKRIQKRFAPNSKHKSTKQKQVNGKNLPQVTELKEEFRPPEWLTGTIPRKTPYVPQMGDEVMYFRQGHELYLQAVLRHNAYEINPNMNQPWHKIPNLREVELVKIVGIRYEVKPPRLVSLKLAFINQETGRLLGRTFTIRYHDMPDVIDFLVLRQHFDISYRRRWKTGDRFRSMIDDQWWMGVIKSQSPLHMQFPDSPFQCFYVHWDNGEYERLSPWDMEPINENLLPSSIGGGVPVDPEELKRILYLPKPGEWSSFGREVETERILQCLEVVMMHSVAEPFNAPVDLNAFPLYAYIIEYPIDLSTIKARLENGYYRRISALQWDVRHIERNAKKFNEDGTPISRSAAIVTETILRVISDTNCRDPMPILEKLSHGQQFHWGNSDTDDDDDDSTTGSSNKRKRVSDDHRNSKRTRTEMPADAIDWRDQCWELLGLMLECEDAEPFKEPVDPAAYPNYHNVVENPMDFKTVGQHLESGAYESPLAFAKDVRLIFANSRLFNTNKRSRIFSMTLRLSAMFEERVKKTLGGWRVTSKSSRLTHSSPNSQSSLLAERAKQFASSSRWVESQSSSRDSQPSTSGLSNGSKIQGSIRTSLEEKRNRKPALPQKKKTKPVVESESDKSEDENSDEEEEEEKLPVSRRAKSSQSDKENVCYNEDEDTEIEEGSGSAWRSKARSPGKNGLRGSKRRATAGSKAMNGEAKYCTRAKTGSLKPKRLHYL